MLHSNTENNIKLDLVNNIDLNNVEVNDLKLLIQKIIATGNITELDLEISSIRKISLLKFEGMLNQDLSEGKWQGFFKENQWIFGYGLDYRFVESQNREVQIGYGNIDFASLNKFSVLIEIKLPTTELFKKCKLDKGFEKSPNRADAWSLHPDFIDAISQVLGYKANWQLECEDKRNRDFGDFKTLDPKVILIIGRLDKLEDDIINIKNNRIRIETFELFRRNNRNIEIITYDELYERAKFIAEGNI